MVSTAAPAPLLPSLGASPPRLWNTAAPSFSSKKGMIQCDESPNYRLYYSLLPGPKHPFF